MTTQLIVYNGALTLMGERHLTAIDTPATEQSQIKLDLVWAGGARDYCLEQASWNFATRSAEFSYDPDVTPTFGLRYAFEKPSDWMRTAAVCSDEFFVTPVLDYRDEGGYWFSDLQTLYIKYISNDAAFGYDLSLWPETFVKCVSAYLAMETCEAITQSRVKRIDMEKKFLDRLHDASAKDVFNQATQIPAAGSWVRSRAGWTSRDPRRGR